jgi:hypothetical protein
MGQLACRYYQVLEQAAAEGGQKKRLNMESKFSQAALDIIGGAVQP